MGPLIVELQGTLNTLASLVQIWNSWFCSSAVSLLQFQGVVIGLLLGCGWTWAGIMRLRELRRQQRMALRDYSLQHAAQRQVDSSQGSKGCTLKEGQQLPGVTVVLPVKGCRKHSLANWQSQLSMKYGGSLEVVFVVDSEADSAFHSALSLGGSMKGASVRVLVAGPSRSNSQKIHNIISGIKAANPEHEYVLCADDDVALHPGTLQAAIERLLELPECFMATGYPLDIPPPTSDLLTYCVLCYHLPLLIAFSLRQKTDFVWGGFMLLPLKDMLSDKYGIMKAWSDGGYSDDLIVAAKCGEHGMRICCPSIAIFPQRLEGDYDWRRYWNYLRRQLYVMDTYSSPLNQRINQSMMLLHSYLSIAFVAPATTVALRLLLWLLGTLLLPTQKVYGGPQTPTPWLGLFGAGACTLNTLSLVAFLAALGFAAVALRWMTSVVLALFKELNPNFQDIDPDAFSWPKLWLGFYINNAVLPFCALYTSCTAHVTWSGVKYWRRGGRIVRVQRPAEIFQRPAKTVELA